MKRTLFNTMMGCLAALSLAGCGGSGSSSSGPSESLISEGFNVVVINAWDDASGSDGSAKYGFALDSSKQTFDLILPRSKDDPSNAPYHYVTGTWSAKSLGNGKFEISLLDDASKQSGCTISARSFVLTIDNMEEYRTGVKTGATLDKAPFTHEGTCGYSCNTEGIQSAEIEQRSLAQ